MSESTVVEPKVSKKEIKKALDKPKIVVGELNGKYVYVLHIYHGEFYSVGDFTEGLEGPDEDTPCFVCQTHARAINILAEYCKKNWIYLFNGAVPSGATDRSVINGYYRKLGSMNFSIKLLRVISEGS